MSEIASAGQLRAAYLRWVLFLVPGILFLGFLSGRLGDAGPRNVWFAQLAKPALAPPTPVFMAIWVLAYVLMGLAVTTVVTARGAPGRGPAIAVFALQLLANLAWAPLLFGWHQIMAALVLLLLLDLLVVLAIGLFARIRPLAAGLMAPYLLWLLFATALNWQVLTLNEEAGARDGGGAQVRLQM